MSLGLGNDMKASPLPSPGQQQQLQHHQNDFREHSRSKMEKKQNKKIVRLLTVIAYVISVSMAAIILSLYYVFLWEPKIKYSNVVEQHQHHMNQNTSNPKLSLTTQISLTNDLDRRTETSDLPDSQTIDEEMLVFGDQSLPRLKDDSFIGQNFNDGNEIQYEAMKQYDKPEQYDDSYEGVGVQTPYEGERRKTMIRHSVPLTEHYDRDETLQ